ncbi:hypothetical protein Pcinc_023318 [Petrolisthes cinctipes]|uniref:Uncharacterized protein n=1 Tax=Petrolisthes cinctipes TaxID=88211 RepID=A0AAE1KFG5_PETCI|nr:hypothetical protein Pcinc_023318 [Petrolisthes cinctipes]
MGSEEGGGVRLAEGEQVCQAQAVADVRGSQANALTSSQNTETRSIFMPAISKGHPTSLHSTYRDRIGHKEYFQDVGYVSTAPDDLPCTVYWRQFAWTLKLINSIQVVLGLKMNLTETSVQE